MTIAPASREMRVGVTWSGKKPAAGPPRDFVAIVFGSRRGRWTVQGKAGERWDDYDAAGGDLSLVATKSW